VLHPGPSVTVPVDSHSYYCKYGPMVLRRCRKLLRDDQAARDAMHDVCLNKIRSRKRRPEDGDDLVAEIAEATDPAARNAARAVLDALFRHEPADTALIAMLHLHDKMTLEETAAEVGLSVSGVRKRLDKLRTKLRHMEVP
jgi:RNA polymerase sigma-70 factor (ECF subfamily)